MAAVGLAAGVVMVSRGGARVAIAGLFDWRVVVPWFTTGQ